VLPSGRKVILSDTVGFISDLPTQLVAAFRATLEEVLEADLIVHVRDISHPETAEQAADVDDILTSLGVKADTPQIVVWNKLDLVDATGQAALVDQAEKSDRVFAASALTGQGMDVLLEAISRTFDEDKADVTLDLPFADGKRRAWLHAEGVVVSEVAGDDGYTLAVRWTARQAARFDALG
jgi:GTPase